MISIYCYFENVVNLRLRNQIVSQSLIVVFILTYSFGKFTIQFVVNFFYSSKRGLN